MKKTIDDTRFVSNLITIMNYHVSMINDGMRNKPFYEALQECVTPESKVLDIGSGTGIWAIMAAKLGAKKVVAIEQIEMLTPIIYQHARENGVADRIEIIQGFSTNVRLREKFDVIVSETIGNEAFDEQIVDIFLDARDRFLKPGGVMIPQSLQMMCAPVFLKGSVQDLPQDVPFSCEFLKSMAVNVARRHMSRESFEILAEPKSLIEIDFLSLTEKPKFENLSATWKLADISRANAFIVYAKSKLTDSVMLDTFPALSWAVVACEFMPFPAGEGEILFNVTTFDRMPYWTVSVPASPELGVRTYAPLFSAAKLKMGVQTTPRRIVKPKKKKEAPRQLKQHAGK